MMHEIKRVYDDFMFVQGVVALMDSAKGCVRYSDKTDFFMYQGFKLDHIIL